MTKKILVLTGSPRKDGNSDQMADALIRGAESAGHIATKVRAADLNVKGCVACGGCFRDENHACVHDDDFNEIAKMVMDADVVVFAAPLYWSTFPAGIKAVIDNFFAFYGGGRSVAGKTGVLLSCGEDTGYNMFDGIQRTFELMLPVLEWRNGGMVLAHGVNEIGDIQNGLWLKRCEAIGRNL